MNFRDRLFVNLKTTSFKMMILMTIFYGLIFGGITQIEGFVDGSISIKDVIYTIIATTIVYGMMFLLITVIVYNAQGIKMLSTLGISRKNLVKCWRDFHLYIFVMGMMGATIILIITQVDEGNYLYYRLLNMDLNHPGIGGLFQLLITIMMVIIGLLGSVNMVAHIGNHFGWRWVVNTVIGLVAILILVIPSIIGVITWGTNYWVMMVVLLIIDVATISLSYRFVSTLEVKR